MTDVIKVQAEFEIPRHVWDSLEADLEIKSRMISLGIDQAGSIDYFAFAVLKNCKVVENETRNV